MTELIVHGVLLSQHTRRVVALLEQAELSYELRAVDLGQGAHLQAPFARLNPTGRCRCRRFQRLPKCPGNRSIPNADLIR